MKCSLLDVPCHVQAGLVAWWGALEPRTQIVFIIGAVLIVAGVIWSIWGLIRTIGVFLKRIGGWPAVIGGIVVALGLILSLFTGKRPAPQKPIEEPPPKKRKTIFDFGKRS